MYLQEISQNYKQKLNEIDPIIRGKILERDCENCKKDLGNLDVSYVITSKGEVRWWHNLNKFNQRSCV